MDEGLLLRGLELRPPVPAKLPMIPDLDIYRAAKLLVDQHGEDAPIRAAELADEMLEAGDIEGAARVQLRSYSAICNRPLGGSPL